MTWTKFLTFHRFSCVPHFETQFDQCKTYLRCGLYIRYRNKWSVKQRLKQEKCMKLKKKDLANTKYFPIINLLEQGKFSWGKYRGLMDQVISNRLDKVIKNDIK